MNYYQTQNRLIKFLEILLAVGPACALAQSQIADPALEVPYRWHRITGEDVAIIRPFIGYKALSLSLAGAAGKSIDWQPNVGAEVGADFYYKRISGLGFAYSLPQAPGEKGKTNAYDFRFSLGRGPTFFQLDFQHYKGFYSSDPPFSEAPFHDGDLTLNNVGLRSIYLFHPERFSFEAVRNQSVRQISSGGSLLAGLHLGFSEASSPNGLIPAELKPHFNSDADLQRVWSLELIPRVGYGYTWVFAEKWFLGGYGLVGIGAAQVFFNYGSAESGKNRLKAAVETEIFGAIGYTGDEFLSSLDIEGNTTGFPGSASSLTRNMVGVNLNFGWRF